MTKGETILGAGVKLATGGPAMVVFREPTDANPDTAACGWFVGTELRKDAFPIAALVPIVDAPSPDLHGLD